MKNKILFKIENLNKSQLIQLNNYIDNQLLKKSKTPRDILNYEKNRNFFNSNQLYKLEEIVLEGEKEINLLKEKVLKIKKEIEYLKN